MRILKSLSKILIIFSLIFIQELNHKLFSNEPVDIWNLEKKEKKDESGTLDDETIEYENINIIKIKKVNKEENQIIKDDKLLINNITLVVLFYP